MSRGILALIRFAGTPIIIGLLAGSLWVLMSKPTVLQGLFSENNERLERVSYSDAVRKASPSVVNIYTKKALPNRQHPLANHPLFRRYFNNAPNQERLQSTLGSGVIIREDGSILTNHHVVNGASEIVVLLSDGREAAATIVGTDSESDLAVLKIEADNLQAISQGDSERVHVGDVVLAIGNPLGVGQTVTQGIISAIGRRGLNLSTFEDFIQTDASINPGNSGGALIDARGNLIGINSAILDSGDGIGFAIPAKAALKVMNDILTYGRPVRGWLGVEAQTLSPPLAQSLQVEEANGIVITAIYRNGPAHTAGIKPGDVITHIDGEAVRDGQRGMSRIADRSPGDQVQIRISRQGQILNLTATVGTRPTAG